ncbi:hypothetical protein [Aquihabitans sp. McL0605]|uniref:hypothetical protein n=1 Tax=Aquihabitans sp. McL0605 TaxID=3415671 RepID=UPI003CE7AB78
MGMKRNGRALGAAWAADELVLLRRNIWKADILEGFVVDLDDGWTVINVVYDVGLNGWSVVRLSTLREVERQPPTSFLSRALVRFGEQPEPLDADLSSCEAVIRSLAVSFPLLTIFTEADDPRVCAVGRPVRLTKSAVHLLDISAEGTWDETKPRRFRYDDITRIDVGGRYETALHELGGYPPVSG